MRISTNFLLLIIVSLSMTACGADEPKNQIMPMTITAEQQQIMELISTHGHQVLLFEFNTTEPFTEVGIRLEVYEYGIITDTALGFSMLGIDRPLDGKIAVVITENKDGNTLDWIVTIHEGGSAASGRATTAIGENINARMHGPMHEAVNISGDTDAVIFVSRFASDGVLSTVGDFAHEPLAHVLTVSFSY
ncbi:MAG: hypothetical protein FWF78_04790 [Defluviitaleaceae bacterium]|nr:hypothetical protein [Defluviitaleaceae bacterium]